MIHIATTSSDHIPILLQVQKFVVTYGKLGFMFKNSWANEKECVEVTIRSWKAINSLDLQSRLRIGGKGLEK